MDRKYNTYENDEYKFVEFSDILKDIRDSYLDDLDQYGPTPRFRRKFLKDNTLTCVLRSYPYVHPMKTNVILISKDVDVYTAGLLDDKKLLEDIISILNDCKRKIPFMIKFINCNFSDLEEFLKTGEGIEFILHVKADKERLRKNACSFSEFKKWARNNGLKGLLDEIVDKKEFKCLFYS